MRLSFEIGQLATECAGSAKKRGVRKICAWKLFFALTFGYFFVKKKVRELEALYNVNLIWSSKNNRRLKVRSSTGLL